MACPEISSSMTFNDYLAALSAPVKLSDATDLFAIGLSLYLALGIVQIAASVGISTLRRKAETYRNYVVQNRKTDKYPISRDLSWEVQAAEIDADGVNKMILKAVLFCLLFTLPYFVWAVMAGELFITGMQLALLAALYILLPVLLLLVGLVLVRRKTRRAWTAVTSAFRDMYN
jgi:hypothetical protein